MNCARAQTGASSTVCDDEPFTIAKEGIPPDQIRKICQIVDGDISAEVITEHEAMVVEARGWPASIRISS